MNKKGNALQAVHVVQHFFLIALHTGGALFEGAVNGRRYQSKNMPTTLFCFVNRDKVFQQHKKNFSHLTAFGLIPRASLGVFLFSFGAGAGLSTLTRVVGVSLAASVSCTGFRI